MQWYDLTHRVIKPPRPVKVVLSMDVMRFPLTSLCRNCNELAETKSQHDRSAQIKQAAEQCWIRGTLRAATIKVLIISGMNTENTKDYGVIKSVLIAE